MTQLRHYDNLGSGRFVTFSCHDRRPYLSDPVVAKIFLEELDRARQKHCFKLLAYVVMPEHVHLVVLPPEDMKLGLVIREIKSRTARAALPLLETRMVAVNGAFWLRRCYDHNCRSASYVEQIINYCHQNPVKRGLVQEPEDWEWSSYRVTIGLPGTLLSIDRVEM